MNNGRSGVHVLIKIDTITDFLTHGWDSSHVRDFSCYYPINTTLKTVKSQDDDDEGFYGDDF